MKNGRKLFFHAKGSASTTYITGNGGDIFYVDHFYGFFTDCFCGNFQINFLCDRQYKNIILFTFSLHDKCFKRLLHRSSGGFGCVKPINEFVTFIIDNFIRYFIFVKNAHGIRLYFFSHGNLFPFRLFCKL